MMSKDAPVVLTTFKITKPVQSPGDGKKVDTEIELAVMEPTAEDWRTARRQYNKTFSDAVNSGAIVREKMEEVLKAQGLWDDEKTAELEVIQRKMQDKERSLADGGIKLSDAKRIAFDIRELRNDQAKLIAPRTQLDGNSAQGQADNEQFNCLVSRCVVYNDSRKRFFQGYEDFLNNAAEEEATKSANVLAKHLYGVDDDFRKKFVENRFLMGYGFVDSKLRLINKDKKLVDDKGNLIDDEGYYVNNKGQRVDEKGTRITKEGDYIVDSKPFLDDSGKEVEGDWDYGKEKKKEGEETPNLAEELGTQEPPFGEVRQNPKKRMPTPHAVTVPTIQTTDGSVTR